MWCASLHPSFHRYQFMLLGTKAHGCKQLAKGCCSTAQHIEVDLPPVQLQIQCSHHYITVPSSTTHCQFNHITHCVNKVEMKLTSCCNKNEWIPGRKWQGRVSQFPASSASDMPPWSLAHTPTPQSSYTSALCNGPSLSGLSSYPETKQPASKQSSS